MRYEMKYVLIASDQDLLKIKKLWQKYNKEYFNNKLSDIDIKWMKQNKRLSTLAYYNRLKNQIAINKRLLKNKEILNKVLLHEMCHQAVVDIDGDIKCVHCSKWKNWMKKCKLEPNINTDASELLDENDKKIRQQDIEKYNAKREKEKDFAKEFMKKWREAEKLAKMKK